MSARGNRRASEAGAAALPPSLRRRWLLAGSVSIAVLLATWSALRGWPRSEAWLGASLLQLAGLMTWLRLLLPLNREEEGRPLFRSLGAGNVISITRAVLAVMLMSLLVATDPLPDLPSAGPSTCPSCPGWLAWLPAVLYLGVGLGDLLDGLLARRSGRRTLLGARLDVGIDGYGVLAATLLAVTWGRLAGWYVLVGVARYLFLAGVWWRRRSGRPVLALPESGSRRFLAGFQMGFLAVVLWPVVPAVASRLAGWVVAPLFLAGFVRDWLVVSGLLTVTAARYLVWRRRWRLVLLRWLPIVLRIAVLAALSGAALDPFDWREVLGVWTWPLALSGLVAAAAVAVGAVVRLASAVLILALLVQLRVEGGAADSLPLPLAVLIVGLVGIAMLGGGALMLWRGEDRALGIEG